jgi:serine/threonine protein kinase
MIVLESFSRSKSTYFPVSCVLTRHRSRWLSPAGLDLAERLLSYDPAQRVTAVDALEAPYFRQENPPAALPVGYVFEMSLITLM